MTKTSTEGICSNHNAKNVSKHAKKSIKPVIIITQETKKRHTYRENVPRERNAIKRVSSGRPSNLIEQSK